MSIKVLKTEAEYEAALRELTALMQCKPPVGSPEGNQLEVLALLIQDYESREYPLGEPDPIEAIRFRMEQQGLSPRDLVPYLGSRSRVSEVLSGKRPLTLAMIRALHSGLGIPAEALLQEGCSTGDSEVDWARFPLKELFELGWISGDLSAARHDPEPVLRPFLGALGDSMVEAVLWRRTKNIRSARSMDEYALTSWVARVMTLAMRNPCPRSYLHGTVDLSFMQRVARLSTSEQGPLMARDLLRENGIALVVERHLQHTYLDGAAIMARLDSPVLGLTLRHDRVDNFWYSLMHELAHVSLHYTEEAVYFDDLDLQPEHEAQSDAREREADELAREALIPQDAWRKSAASRLRSPEAAYDLAKRLGIHPAIVAGRMRYEFKAYHLLKNLVGHGEVRRLFREVDWS